MSVQTSARHRAAQRPSTPLSALGSAGQIGRRTAIVAASSGLVLTIAAPAAMASPEAAQAPQSASKAATQLARTTAPAVSSTVVVPSDAQWTIAETQVTATRPAPPPPPVVRETTTRSTATASRSNARGAAAVSTTSASQAAAPAPAPSVSGNAVLSIAYRYIGVPYVRGGSTPAGFDCSGFTQYVYAQLGISIPRSSAAQRGAGRVVSASEARPGDLVWWPGHVGIYVGNGQHIAARQPGTPLKVSPIYRSGATFIRVA